MMNVLGCWRPVSIGLQRSVCVCVCTVIIRFDSMVLLWLVSAGFLLPPRTSLSPKHMHTLVKTQKINDYVLAEALKLHPVGVSYPITRINIARNYTNTLRSAQT